MINTIDMQMMRYINLFEKITHVSTTNCFVYNNTLIFAIPRNLISKAIGKDGINVRRIGEAFRKKVKVIEMPFDESEISKFIADIVSPISFNKVELREGIVTLNAGRQSKAALIGRNRAREQELEDILKKVFGISKLRII